MKINPYVYPGLKFDLMPFFNFKKNTIDVVLKVISQSCQVSIEDILSKKRHQHIVRARHMASGILRYEFRRSFMDISKIFDRKDHTSSIHSVKFYNKNYFKRQNYKNFVDSIIKEINSQI